MSTHSFNACRFNVACGFCLYFGGGLRSQYRESEWLVFMWCLLCESISNVFILYTKNLWLYAFIHYHSSCLHFVSCKNILYNLIVISITKLVSLSRADDARFSRNFTSILVMF